MATSYAPQCRASTCTTSMLRSFPLLVVLLLGLAHHGLSLKGKAGFTYFESYPRCCKGPNYDPNAPKDECKDYNGCKYQGDFENGDHLSLDQVKKTDIVAFYDDKHPGPSDCDDRKKYWEDHYKNRQIRLTKGNVSFTATILDTCCDADTKNGDCHKNTRSTGYLVDVEWFTVLRHFKNIDKADGTLNFEILGTSMDPAVDPAAAAAAIN